MDLDILITGGVGVVTTFISGFSSYIFTKRKYDAEVDSNRITNMQASLDFYEKNQDANKKILDILQKENLEFREENKRLKEQLDSYEDKIRDLEDINDALNKRLESLEADIKALKAKSNETKTKKNSKKA